MTSRIATVAVALFLTSAAQVMASDETPTTPATTTANIKWTTATEATVAAEEASVVPVNATVQTMSLARTSEVSGRGSLLPGLYLSLASLNAYDAHTTNKGIASGAREANGIMRLAGGSPAAVWAIKGGITAATILTAEHLWHTHRRGQAIGMMLATNGLMALVGAQNHSVVSQR